MPDNFLGQMFTLFTAGFAIVLVGVVLKDASGVNTIFQGYTGALGQLEKAG